MADAAEFKFDTKKLELAMKKFPGELHNRLAGAFSRSGIEMTAAMEDRVNGKSGPPDWRNTGDKIVSRSGNLARSIGHKTTKGADVDDLTLAVYVGDANTPYARIQEEGGTVTGSPWLTVPLSDNYTASGVVRFQSAAALRDDPSWTTWIARNQEGTAIIWARREGEEGDGNWLALWALKRQVTIKARLGFRAMWESRADRNLELAGKAINRALGETARRTK